MVKNAKKHSLSLFLQKTQVMHQHDLCNYFDSYRHYRSYPRPFSPKNNLDLISLYYIIS